MAFGTEATELDGRRRWTRAEYERLVSLGVFEDERVELVEGDILTMSPQGSRHAYVVRKLAVLLGDALRGLAEVVVQSPFAASAESEPEPDLAVVAPDEGSVTAHPAAAFLVVEVAEESLRRDLGLKARVYAAAAVVEYWVVDLVGRRVVVHRASDGARWGDVRAVEEGERLGLAAFAGVEVRLDAVLPRE